MKSKKFFLRDKQGYYLVFVNKFGGYYAHRLSSFDAMSFDSYLVALTFANGYNLLCNDVDDFVTPFLETA